MENISNTKNSPILIITCGVMALVIIAGAIFVAIKQREYSKQITNLHNEVASKESTIETQKDVYVKSSMQLTNLTNLLNSANKEQTRLKDQIKKSKNEVLALTEVGISFKKDYESKLPAKQTAVVEAGKNRSKIEFSRDFGPYKVSGHTLTEPVEAFVKLSQTRPLRLTLAITQMNDKSWKTLVSSSEEDFSVDVKISAVNPTSLDRRWYERIGLVSYLGGGTAQSKAGALLGLGATVGFSQFSLGPSVWFSTTGLQDRYYGLSLTYFPFYKNP